MKPCVGINTCLTEEYWMVQQHIDISSRFTTFYTEEICPGPSMTIAERREQGSLSCLIKTHKDLWHFYRECQVLV